MPTLIKNVESNLEKILKTVERISFSIIGLLTALFLLNTVLNLGPGTYGRTLLQGLSVFLAIGAVILFLWVAYNVFTYSRPEVKKKP